MRRSIKRRQGSGVTAGVLVAVLLTASVATPRPETLEITATSIIIRDAAGRLSIRLDGRSPEIEIWDAKHFGRILAFLDDEMGHVTLSLRRSQYVPGVRARVTVDTAYVQVNGVDNVAAAAIHVGDEDGSLVVTRDKSGMLWARPQR